MDKEKAGCSGKSKCMQPAPVAASKNKTEINKYDTARKLHIYIDKIRATYRKDWEDPDETIRQRSVALYFIDTLGFRVGHEKGDNETVGCCTLRVEHVKPEDEDEYILEFDFLGKGSVEYKKKNKVEKSVFENIKRFTEGKTPKKEIFDKLNAQKFNYYLKKEFGMPELTAKVFRTYNASITMKRELDKCVLELEDPKKAFKEAHSSVVKFCHHKNRRTSVLNYIDPRIVVAWCHKHEVPIDQFYGKSLRRQHGWAIEQADYDFEYDDKVTIKMNAIKKCVNEFLPMNEDNDDGDGNNADKSAEFDKSYEEALEKMKGLLL